MDDLAVFCADIGSMKTGRFGWACGLLPARTAGDLYGTHPEQLVEAVAQELGLDHRVALGFECPLFVPIPESAMLSGLRAGERGGGPGPAVWVAPSWPLASCKRRGC
jgi:hypothetical protein